LIAFHNYPVLLGTAAFAVIDNVTRKLMEQGKRSVGGIGLQLRFAAVGLFFSVGHSTVVVGLSVAIAIITAALQSQFDAFESVGGIIGTLVSALFLFAIATANVRVLISVYRIFRTVKSGGRFVEEDLDIVLASRGLLGRLFRRFFRVVESSWQMYPLRVLFGLGFDTATEVGLLGISAGH
jgi:high-affinity nickel-transport protein